MSSKAKRIFGHMAAVTVVLACGDEPTAPPAPAEISRAATVYLNRALNIMEFSSIKRYEIEWITFRTQAFADARAAKTLTR